ncbi:hypothetical protein PHYBOEH_008621 [Phytophthora boehmeriae]|uniref:Peptidase S1 domain-containing protein n=1 Tax=Phytophthora boehmeriae TaxID=109152 RepID=A0A8T1VZQ2_9STRA|nr:hypothetical protein PHYBOEH_008621 [Phytophthora boehmeriae]
MKVVLALVATCVAVTFGPLPASAQDNTNLVEPTNSFVPNTHSSGVIQAPLRNDSNEHIVPVGNLVSSNLPSDAIRTSLGGHITTVPKGSKTYVAGLRATIDGNNFCSASLISPTHLLVGTYCVSGNIRWASIGSHYSNGTQDGEQIKVVAIMNHPETSGFSNDFAVLKLEKPSSLKPVELATADDSDVQDGEWAAKMGWDDTGGVNTMAYELQRADVQLMSNENCLKETRVDGSMLCSRGATNETSCTGDYGGPVVVERPSGDVLVGVVSWGDDCDKPGYPSIYSRVSSVRAWIASLVGGECFH